MLSHRLHYRLTFVHSQHIPDRFACTRENKLACFADSPLWTFQTIPIGTLLPECIECSAVVPSYYFIFFFFFNMFDTLTSWWTQSFLGENFTKVLRTLHNFFSPFNIEYLRIKLHRLNFSISAQNLHETNCQKNGV